MSFRMPIDRRSQMAGRFIASVHDEIQDAFVKSGMKQNELAKKLGINRSAINRQLLGQTNLTLRSISDLAWALDCQLPKLTILCPNPSTMTNSFASSSMDDEKAKKVKSQVADTFTGHSNQTGFGRIVCELTDA